MSVLCQKPIPVPTAKQPIRPQPRRETSPFVKVIDGRRIIDSRLAPPDPDAIERMLRLGLLRPEQETVTAESGERQEVTVLKRRSRKGIGGGGQRQGPTYDVEECVRLAATGKWTAKDLAERYGVEPSTIRTRLRSRGVEPVKASDRVDRKRIVDLYAEGMTVGGIHAETGNAIGTIYRVLDTTPGLTRRDDRAGKIGSLTPEIKARAVEFKKAGLSSRETARRMGIAPSSVRRIWQEAQNAQG